MLSSELGWPAIPIGSSGRTFTVTDEQLKRLASFDAVVIVDSAIRTGDTLSAIVRALDDSWLLKHTTFLALCILDALSHTSRIELAQELGIDIRTLFQLPLCRLRKKFGIGRVFRKRGFVSE